MTTQDKEARRLSKAKVSVMRHPKFALLSGLMTCGVTKMDETTPTAYTNGRDMVYGREFVKSLTDKELAFVMLHETMHVAFKHLFVWRKLMDENRYLANAACDYVINLMLVETDPDEVVIAMPRKGGEIYGLLDFRFKGMNAKQVFDILKQEQQGEDGDEGEEGDEGGQPGDKPGRGKSKGQPQGFDEHDWDGAKKLTEEEREELGKEIDRAIREGQIAHKKLAGKGAGGLDRALGELIKPKVDWREELREFVKSICSAKDTSSWRKVSRRFLSSDVYMPSLVGERIGSIAIGIDTSGSINGNEITRFLSEVNSIAEDVHPQHVDLIYWDSRVANHEVYDEGNVANIVSSTKPKGGGGTMVKCLFDYIEEKLPTQPEVCIIFTDGETPYPESPKYPVLWLCTTDIVAPFGKTVRMEI